MKGTHRLRTIPAGALLAAAALALLSPLATPAHAARPVERHNWVAGVAYGVGRADVDLNNDEIQTGWTKGASPQFRFGKMIGSHFSIGLENREWLDEGGNADYKVRANFQNFNVVLTAYPGRTSDMTSGFFIHAGAGISHARLSALEPIPGGGDQWGNTYEELVVHDESGFGYMVGAGYELRVSSHFAVGAVVSYNSLTFDDQVFDQVKFFPGGLNLNWYF